MSNPIPVIEDSDRDLEGGLAGNSAIHRIHLKVSSVYLNHLRTLRRYPDPLQTTRNVEQIAPEVAQIISELSNNTKAKLSSKHTEYCIALANGNDRDSVRVALIVWELEELLGDRVKKLLGED